MTVTIPAAINLHTQDHDLDARARGVNGSPAMGVKGGGNLPFTTDAPDMVNATASSQTGAVDFAHWEFAVSPSRDVSTDTLLLVWTWQFNAPNRLQVSDLVNDGICFRIGSGTGSPPTNYKHYQIGGRDTEAGKSRERPLSIVIDLNDTSNESTGGTFDNTDVQTYGYGTVRWDMVGTNNNRQYFQRAFLFTTTKNSSDIPRFTAASDWDDLIGAVDGTSWLNKISSDWAVREGNVYTIKCPIEFGNNSTVTTFNDNGAIVFWPDRDVASDPRVRATSQAFRVYANLRDNSGDSIVLTGAYDCGDSSPDWDFDLDFASTITITGATFKNVGVFTIGSSVTGVATFENCGVVTVNNNGANLNGSTFKAAAGAHLLRIPL